jgi:putative membrane protein
MQRGLLTGITLGVAMVIFTLQNEVKIPVKILWAKFTDVPLVVILLISFLAGVSIISVFSFIDKQRLKTRIKRLQIRLKNLEDPTYEDGIREEGGDTKGDNSMMIHGEPGTKFFDD